MKKTLTGILVLIFLMAACQPGTPDTQAEVATSVASTLQALTPTVPPGISVSFENVSLIIPASLGTGISSSKTGEIEYPPCANPSCVDLATAMPEHLVLTIKGYPLQRQARIAIFKASEYAEINESFQADISNLQSLKSHPDVIPDSLTFPFATQIKYVAFPGMYGFRYLTQINDGFAPISNDGLFYYFQGLTDDDLYFVMAILPVSAPFLAADDNPISVQPTDAVPFDWSGSSDIPLYYEKVAQQINAAKSGTFSPSLGDLDTMIESIHFAP